MPTYNKVIKSPTPNKIRPKTDFSGTQVVDESTNYERFDDQPGAPGKSMWTNAKKAKGSKGAIGGPGLTHGRK